MTTSSESAQPQAIDAAAQERAAPAALRSLLSGRQLLAQKFQHFQNAFHEEGHLDARLLELCRARIDTLHGITAATDLDEATAKQIARGDFSHFSQLEQQALSVAEQIAIDAHGVSDQQVHQLNELMGEAATVSLMTAASMHDASIRLQQVLSATVAPTSERG